MSLSTLDLLTAWDWGRLQHPIDRALTLLSSAYPDTGPSAWAQRDIGERDAHLLRLREAIFGPHLAALADCPECSGRLDLEFDVEQLNALRPEAAPLCIDENGFRVEFRLPNSEDLRAIGAVPDVATGREILLRRCIMDDTPTATLPGRVDEAIAAAMARADPQGDVQLALDCPFCGCHWEEIFDIASFLWNEVHAFAMRTFREVHQLASAYGWSEADIVGMSPRRRQIYLEMLGG